MSEPTPTDDVAEEQRRMDESMTDDHGDPLGHLESGDDELSPTQEQQQAAFDASPTNPDGPERQD